MNDFAFDSMRTQLEKLYKVEFYKVKFDQFKVKPSEINSWKDFQKLPFTENHEIIPELKKNPNKCSLYHPKVTRINYSPAGADIFPIYNTNKDIITMCKACKATLQAAGINTNDICAVTFGYHLFIAGLFYQTQLEYFGAKVIPIGPGESKRAAKIINELNASVLISNPSYAIKLAANKIDSVRILFVGGEPFSSIKGYDEKVKNAFSQDITIIDSYSMALCHPIARGCLHGNGLHIVDDFVYAEIIDPENMKQLPEKEIGELVLTHIKKDAVPLLRYRTGDLTYMVNETCKCGRKYTLPKGIIGRSDEMIKVKGVKFYPSQIENIIKEILGIHKNFRLIIDNSKGVDNITLVIPIKLSKNINVEKIKNKIEKNAYVSINRIQLVNELENGLTIVDNRN